jgi:hypothetical protein
MDRAYLAAGLDDDTAKEISRDPLEAIGALPYEIGTAADEKKRCSKCGQYKDIEKEFTKNTRSPDKRAAMCNQCKGRGRS